ncbi:MAG: dienelactone hydrolase family protein [Burkholderiaceae bacterium]
MLRIELGGRRQLQLTQPAQRGPGNVGGVQGRGRRDHDRLLSRREPSVTDCDGCRNRPASGQTLSFRGSPPCAGSQVTLFAWPSRPRSPSSPRSDPDRDRTAPRTADRRRRHEHLRRRTEEGGPFPALLFYMDAPGKRGELHDMARRLASVGFCVVLLNLYYRRSRDFVIKERTEAAMAEMFAHMASLDARTTACDTAALLRYLDGRPGVDGSRIGAVGYCMSGPIVIWAAAAFPQRLRCIASSTARTW